MDEFCLLAELHREGSAPSSCAGGLFLQWYKTKIRIYRPSAQGFDFNQSLCCPFPVVDYFHWILFADHLYTVFSRTNTLLFLLLLNPVSLTSSHWIQFFNYFSWTPFYYLFLLIGLLPWNTLINCVSLTLSNQKNPEMLLKFINWNIDTCLRLRIGSFLGLQGVNRSFESGYWKKKSGIQETFPILHCQVEVQEKYFWTYFSK